MIQVPDGRQVRTIINATPVVSDEGVLESTVVTLQDIAPRKDLERQQAEFLGSVSQELLAPLTSIKGSAAAVLEDLNRLDHAKTRQFFSLIERQADRMRGLIWDLLDVARINAGTLLLAPEPTDLASLVDQAQVAFLEGGAGTPVEVDLLPPDLPAVAVDRQRALQVLDRLLSYVSSTSDEGSVVTVSARREDVHVAVCVAVRGRDMPIQPELFHRPSPMGSGRESAAGGEDLSLTVCRGIVEAHGGRIWIESDGPGLGSRFIFTVPVAVQPTFGRMRPSSLPSAGTRGAGRSQGRVLLVEDDPQALWHIRSTLSEAGYTPVATWDPEEVERLIAMERPHVVLLDAALTEAGGLELLPRIAMATDAPVLILAGRGATRERDLALAFEGGAHDYIAKPFSTTEVLARVGAALRRHDATEPASQERVFQLGELTVDYAKRRVWSARGHGDSSVVRGYVRRLRQKLGETAANPRYIFNEPRVGYRLGEPEDQDAATP